MFQKPFKLEKPLQPAGEKGAYHGICNRTACSHEPAVYYNHSTRMYYCPSCAHDINKWNRTDALKRFGHDLCTKGKVVN